MAATAQRNQAGRPHVIPVAPSDVKIDWLDQRYRDAAETRRSEEGQWYLNLAFYLGYQWCQWDNAMLWQPPLGDMSLPVDNRIKPTVRTAIAKMSKQRPAFTVAPHSMDEEDINAALLSEELADYEWDALDLTRKRRNALFWREITGAALWKVTWDSMCGDYMEVYVDAQGVPLVDADDRPLHSGRGDISDVMGALAQGYPDEMGQIQSRQVAMGDCRVDVVSPFGAFVDPIADDAGLESADWIIEESIQSPGRLAGRYPEHAAQIVPDASASTGTLQERLPGIGRRAKGKTGTRVREMWARKCYEFPEGLHVVWACETVLLSEANPYERDLPYVMFRGDPSGSFWPAAPVTPLISPQVRLNKREAQIDDNADRFGNAALAYPQGTEGIEDWQGLPGEHLMYPATGNPADRPDYLRPPEMPAYLQAELERMVDSMQEISGQHEVSGAQVPAGVTAASAINLLLEQDDTQLGPAVEELEIALAEALTKILTLIARYWTDERMVVTAGEDGDWDIRSFRGQQINGHTAVEAQSGSGLPRSKAARQAAMQSLLDMWFKYGGGPGNINQRNLRRFLRDMQVGGLDKLFADANADETKAQRENRRMLAGIMQPVNAWDNHQYEIDAHNEERKGNRYERAAKANPQIAAIFQAHVQQHLETLIAQQPPPPIEPGQGPPPPGGGGAEPGT